MPLGYRYIHLESLDLLIFLGIVLRTQMRRTADPHQLVRNASLQLKGLLIIFAVLSVGFGGLLMNVSPLFAVELAAGFTLSLIHPANALCFFVHMMFLRPWEVVDTNPLLLALPRLLAGLCFFSWILHPGQHRRLTRSTIGVLGLILAFSLWLLLTSFQTPDPAANQADWLKIYFKPLIVLLMCPLFIESERSVSELELTLVISATGMMAMGFYHFFFLPPNEARLESFGLAGDPNDLAAVLVMAFPLVLTRVTSRAANIAHRFAGALISALSLVVIWYTRSRGAMLALVGEFFASRCVDHFRERWFQLALLAGLLGAGYSTALKVVPRDPGEMEVSSESRIIYWKTAVLMAIRHPLWGVGFQQYGPNYETYSAEVSGEKFEHGKRTAHSSWFLALAETGFPGGILFISFFVAIWRRAWLNRRLWPGQFYALVGYGIAMSFLSHTYSLYYFMLCGLILSTNSVMEQSAHAR